MGNEQMNGQDRKAVNRLLPKTLGKHTSLESSRVWPIPGFTVSKSVNMRIPPLLLVRSLRLSD